MSTLTEMWLRRRQLVASSPCPQLGDGWAREIYRRNEGMLAGREDVAYRSPSDEVFFDKASLVALLRDKHRDATGKTIDWAAFEFKTGRVNAVMSKLGAQTQGGAVPTSLQDLNNRSKPPIRQTASIFKQPVLAMTTQEPNKFKYQDGKLKPGGQAKKDKPLQLFWFKRLQQDRKIAAGQASSSSCPSTTLPDGLESAQEFVDERAAAFSLMATLHNYGNNSLLVGQSYSGARLDEEPSTWYSSAQPFIKPAEISPRCIEKQAARIQDIRAELASTLSKLHKRQRTAKSRDFARLFNGLVTPTDKPNASAKKSCEDVSIPAANGTSDHDDSTEHVEHAIGHLISAAAPPPSTSNECSMQNGDATTAEMRAPIDDEVMTIVTEEDLPQNSNSLPPDEAAKESSAPIESQSATSKAPAAANAPTAEPSRSPPNASIDETQHVLVSEAAPDETEQSRSVAAASNELAAELAAEPATSLSADNLTEDAKAHSIVPEPEATPPIEPANEPTDPPV